MKVRTKAILGLIVVTSLTGIAAVAVRGPNKDGAATTVTVARGDIVDKALAVGTIRS